ncbi:putative OsmC-like protein [Wenyingzhuangia heitensis]|uniref:OsmC-like protein n=1 Tax=Wenyingzhuangia heitensis TaxID=1487859 RepID=A0ABX0UAW6_9FLAO|nr:OsmC family protein [Wenyingzhuangia heitensis]NIJ45080.1 putative OsmC-like protein [Wenyingzhuangia heitensis]
MNYQVKAASLFNQDAQIYFKKSSLNFGTTAQTAHTLPNPAKLFLSSFAACVLKNVERFSELMKFSYTKATIEVTATRLEKPSRMDDIIYTLIIYTQDDTLNLDLLKKNIVKFGTIYNTVKQSCSILGTIKTHKDV